MKRQLVCAMLVLVFTAVAGAVPAAADFQGGNRIRRDIGDPCLCGRDVNGIDACFESRQCVDSEPCNVNTDCNPTPGGYCIPDAISGCNTPGFAGTCALQTEDCPDPEEDPCENEEPPEFPLPDCAGGNGGGGGNGVPLLGPTGTALVGLLLAGVGLWHLRRTRTAARRMIAAILVVAGIGLVAFGAERAPVERRSCGHAEAPPQFSRG